MKRFPLFLYFCLTALALTPTLKSEDGGPSNSVPNRETPTALVEAWLHFHEAELCQGVEAVFVFTKDGMEVQGTIEDEKSYEKLEGLLAPLRNSYKIELHAAGPPQKEKSDEEREPPASLWENYELRSFLGDRVVRMRERPGFEDDPEFVPPPPNPIMKQRLLLYADQTLAWNRKIEKYAKDLPALTRVALDPGLPPELRSEALAVCMAHSQNMEKYVGRLSDSLEPAFPHSRRKEKTVQPQKSIDLNTPVDRADNLSEFAGTVVQGVYRFIHPEHFTVGLDELRQPVLLESLKDLRKLNSDFRNALSRVRK